MSKPFLGLEAISASSFDKIIQFLEAIFNCKYVLVSHLRRSKGNNKFDVIMRTHEVDPGDPSAQVMALIGHC